VPVQVRGGEEATLDGRIPRAPLGVFYDPLSYAAYDHPYDIFASLREHSPVYYNSRRDLWVLSRYADVKECLRDNVRYVNALGNDMDGTHDSYGPGNLIALDDPHHALLRKIVQPSFTGRGINAMESRIREVAHGLIADFMERGGGDVASEIALPLVFDTGLSLVGAPVSDSQFWQEHLLRSMARDVGQFGIPEDAATSNREAEEHLRRVLEARRASTVALDDPSRSDVISQLLVAIDKGLIDDSEATGLAHLVLSASTDAPAALITNCIAFLDKYPALQQHLRQNPALVKGFLEETLRFDTPATNICRQTTTEVVVEGVTIPADSRVMVLLGSANRDPRVFEDPDTFDITREFGPANRILSFGEGIHVCMGAPLARLVAQVILEELLPFLDSVELRVVGNPERWAKQMVRGFSYLPVRLVADGEVQRTTATHASVAHLQAVQHLSARAALTTPEQEVTARVVSKIEEARGVAVITLMAVDGGDLPEWDAGAHVDLVIDGVPTKQYSLSGYPKDLSRYRLGILRDEAGSGASRYVHDTLAVGDEVVVRGPRNNFRLRESPAYIFIAGGIGITPILPMIGQAEAMGSRWTLLYGGRERASMAFLEELAEYGDRVEVRPQDEYGLLDLESVLSTPQENTQIYCCGPAPLLDAVEALSRHWLKGSLHLERFSAKPLTEPVLREPFEVVLQASGKALTVPLEKSILEVVEEAGIRVRSSCTEGTCGTCETAVLAGSPDHRDSVLDDQERESGSTMMICVSRSRTPRLVLNL
jgi:cytochrome P450/ferredoxin-NADP reductase